MKLKLSCLLLCLIAVLSSLAQNDTVTIKGRAYHVNGINGAMPKGFKVTLFVNDSLVNEYLCDSTGDYIFKLRAKINTKVKVIARQDEVWFRKNYPIDVYCPFLSLYPNTEIKKFEFKLMNAPMVFLVDLEFTSVTCGGNWMPPIYFKKNNVEFNNLDSFTADSVLICFLHLYNQDTRIVYKLTLNTYREWFDKSLMKRRARRILKIMKQNNLDLTRLEIAYAYDKKLHYKKSEWSRETDKRNRNIMQAKNRKAVITIVSWDR